MADYSSWKFSWSTRTDMQGYAAGIYTTTPFPITEDAGCTSYILYNDENPTGKTYTLGTKYYVDGAAADDLGDGSWATPFKTIAHAIADVAAGNKCIIIRGAHDAFDGKYTEYDLNLPSGTNDTQRYMLVGYGQERPEINGEGPTDVPHDTFGVAGAGAYITLQRVKVSDNYWRGLVTGSTDSYVNAIDDHFYNNGKWDAAGPDNCHGDGNMYFMGSPYCMAYHCTSEHTYGHCFKVGDGSDYSTVEWCVGHGAGYWVGADYEATAYYGSHSTVFDFPADGETTSPPQVGIVIRYNIGWDSLFYTLQIRNGDGFSCHHNEFWGGPNWDNLPDSRAAGVSCCAVALIYWLGTLGHCHGNLYSNIIRDGPCTDSIGIGVHNVDNADIVYVFNNLVYGCYQGIAAQSTGTDEFHVQVLNNSVYVNGAGSSFYTKNVTGAAEVIATNNIFYQAGAGTCWSELGTSTDPVHTYNQVYAPAGSIGWTNGTGDTTGDPGWDAIPSGEYTITEGRLSMTLPGTSLAVTFTTDANGVTRSAWDRGWLEYVTSSTPWVMIYG